MADNKQGREKKAHDAENRQQERETKEERERMHETEPVVDDTELAIDEPVPPIEKKERVDLYRST